MTRARIALDIRVSTGGGGTTYIQNLVLQLLRIGDEHEFLLIRAPADGLRMPDGVPTLRAPAVGGLGQLLWTQVRLPHILRERRVDLYHSLKHLGPLRCPVPSIFSLRAAGPFDGTYPLSFSENLYWNVLGRLSLRGIDHVIAVSSFVAEGIPSDLRPPWERIRIVPHGLDPRFLDAGQAERKERHVLAVGNVVPVKNFGMLLRAYSTLRADLIERWPLVIAGSFEGREGTALRGLVHDLGLAERVRFTGYVRRQQMLDLYRNAVLFVLSSLHESFSFALLEAMASGACCVTTACGGPVEVGGTAVTVVADTRNPRAMAAAMERLLDDRTLRHELGARARKRAATFSWERTARQTLDVYARALSTSAGHGVAG